MLTMCATYKSPCCCCGLCFFFHFILLPKKRGEVENEASRESCASIFIHAEHALSSRNRDGDERCIYLSFTSWYANIMKPAHQITKVCMNTDFQMQLEHKHCFRVPFFYFLERILSDNSGLLFPLRQ